MPELKSVWEEALKAAKTFCGKNAASKKAFEKLVKSVESKLGSCLGDIDKAVGASDRDSFDKASAKAAPLLKEAQTAYETGLTQNLYKQNDVRTFFAAVTMSKPDSLNGMLKDLTTQMGAIAKTPTKEQLAPRKEERKAEAKAMNKAMAKESKQQAERAAKMAKTAEAVMKIVNADAAVVDDYAKKVMKIKMLANERNGDLLTAANAYVKANFKEKAKAANEYRAMHATCAKLVGLIADLQKTTPSVKKSEAAAAKAYPQGHKPPDEVSSGINGLKSKIDLGERELDELEKMLNKTLGDNRPPKTDEEAEKDAKAAADARKAAENEAVARREGLKPRVDQRKAEQAKADKAKAKTDAKNAKRQEALHAQDKKVEDAVMKIIAADGAKVQKFVGEVQRWKMQAIGADGDLREARDAYQNDRKKADQLKKARDACVSLSAAYKKAQGSAPDCTKSEKALDKAYPSGRLPKAVSDALGEAKADLDKWVKELSDLHIMLDRSLGDIRAPS